MLIYQTTRRHIQHMIFIDKYDKATTHLPSQLQAIISDIFQSCHLHNIFITTSRTVFFNNDVLQIVPTSYYYSNTGEMFHTKLTSIYSLNHAWH